MTDDPTLVRSQPALTTSTGFVWLLLGGLLAAIAVGVLLALREGLVACAVIVALYLGMVVVRLVVPAGRRRLGLMAAGMIGIAVVGLGAVLVIAWGAAVAR